MDGKIDLIEGHMLSEDGVAPVLLSAHTSRNALDLGYPGIVYTPLEMPPMSNGDMLTFRHTVLLCSRCGRLEGICECE